MGVKLIKLINILSIWMQENILNGLLKTYFRKINESIVGRRLKKQEGHSTTNLYELFQADARRIEKFTENRFCLVA